MDEYFSSGRFADVALIGLAIEFGVLVVAWRRNLTGLSPMDVAGHLLAGALLLLAARSAATGADPRLTLCLLAASFPAHLFDLVRRARQTRPPERRA